MGAGGSGGRGTAVVVEDDVDIRELLRIILRQSGFDVVATGDGLDGIEAVREHDPVLVTLDVSMPGMDGFAVTRALREFSDAYVVLLTGRTDEDALEQGRRAGADDLVVKPFRPAELRARIDAAEAAGYRRAGIEDRPGPS